MKINRVDYYYAVKKNDILKFVGKWMELENNYTERRNPGPKRQIYVISGC